MGYLSRSDILAVGFKTAEVEIEGGKVLVRALSSAETEELGFAMYRDGKVDPANAKGRMPQIAIWCALGEDGKPIFHRGDAGRVAKLPWGVVSTIATKALALSDLVEDEDAKGESESDEAAVPNE